jgi:hypothetical protein
MTTPTDAERLARFTFETLERLAVTAPVRWTQPAWYDLRDADRSFMIAGAQALLDYGVRLPGPTRDDVLAPQFAALLLETFEDAKRHSGIISHRILLFETVLELIGRGRIDLEALCPAQGDRHDTAIHVADLLFDRFEIHRHPIEPNAGAAMLEAVIDLVGSGQIDLDGFTPPGPAGDDELPPLDGPPPPGYVDATRETVARMAAPDDDDGGKVVVVDGVLTCWKTRHNLGPCGTCRACTRATESTPTPRPDPIRASLRIGLFANDTLIAEVRDRGEWLRLLALATQPTDRRTRDA